MDNEKDVENIVLNRQKRALLPVNNGFKRNPGGQDQILHMNKDRPNANNNNAMINNNNMGRMINNNAVNDKNSVPMQADTKMKYDGGNNVNLQESQRLHPNNQNIVQKMKISDTPECREDVLKFCHGSTNNFAVLDCLQNDLQMQDDVSVDCQHLLWNYKKNLTKDGRFNMASKEVCGSDLDKITECRSLRESPAGIGFVIPCLIENIENVTDKSCQQYLTKMSTIVFSDYRRVYKFVERCSDDITKYKCGRVGTNHDEETLHNQGSTIDCLAAHMSEKHDALNPKCKKQVLRVLELQSDDYHLDRPLYYACRNDREHFCPDTRAGGGKIYECLFKHITSREMSENCRSKLEFRQRLIAVDVKIDKTFFGACQKDIEKSDCSAKNDGSPPDLKRATILLCLETRMKNDELISGDCVREMKEVRRSIMDDFNVNPDILVNCKDEIVNHCSKNGVGGKTIHCLMALANPRHEGNGREPVISSECKVALTELLDEADVGEDYSIDEVLLKACSSVVQKVCAHFGANDGNTMNCLMDNLDHEDMTGECEKRLLEIQYFIVRDFRLDPQLYRSCKKDAKKLCNDDSDWFSPNNPKPDASPLMLPCLYRHMKGRSVKSNPNPSKQLSRGCRHEIRRVMRERAKSVDLEPEIQDNCVHDLARFCSESADLEHGEEIICLQDNYEDLEPHCQKVIGNFTVDEDADYEMDTRIMKACTPMIKKFCEDLLDKDADPADVLECLIEHKNSRDMNDKCAAGIEHHQIITLKDFQFNHKFKEACQSDVIKYCQTAKTKFAVVNCLSEHVRNDTLLEMEHRIAKKCRKQLKVQVLQREENIKLDPILQKACEEDIKTFCPDLVGGNAVVLTCLSSHQNMLHKSCHKVIFKREKDAFAIADYGIATSCKKMIQEHCSDSDDSEVKIFECLKRAKDDPTFDPNCRTIILRRQISQSHDYRLNPQLSKLCRDDIPKFCKNIIIQQKNDEELEGKVINCLKQQFRIKRLSRECSYEIEDRIKAAAVDIRLAPQLSLICKFEIKKHCASDLLPPDSEQEFAGNGRILECLKDKFLKRELKDKECLREVAFLIEENEIDINVDPLLHTACQVDILHVCNGITNGEGKIMSCLLSTLEDSPKSLSPKCKKLLSNRKQMWEYAAVVAPPESLKEVYDSITQSPAKAYFLGILAAVVAIIFIVGISCGRVTKRVRAELKNRSRRSKISLVENYRQNFLHDNI